MKIHPLANTNLFIGIKISNQRIYFMPVVPGRQVVMTAARQNMNYRRRSMDHYLRRGDN